MRDYQLRLVRQNRKTVRLSFEEPDTVILSVPARMTQGEIDELLRRHDRWIHNRMKNAAMLAQSPLPPYTPEDIRRLADEALRVLPERVRHFAPLVGVTYGRITIRNQKSKWGSCSAQGNLNFNCLLMDAPAEVQDYVVVHELCHRKELNHSPAFWGQVARVLPGYKEQEKWLRTEGQKLIRRMTGR